ncbi:helix-turn-helix transcriptional regulator [Streptomyces sp. NPDC093249]|uniref:helix-turn-helix transcriptional regulator n=1 Tax=unclassified Streptomyces TaxID=2593676 RepID=UPI00344FCB7B
MGLAGQLKSWRKRGRVTQEECANAVGRSVRWWRHLERGDGRNRLDLQQCEDLAALLQLDRDERTALLLYNRLDTTVADGMVDPRVRSGLRLLIDQQMPAPTYLCDANWNILGFNPAMAQWYPWVLKPGANLIKWALTDREARVQYHDWEHHASEYVKLIKFALARRGDSAELMELIGDVCKDPDVRRLWETTSELTEVRDGHIFRMSLPALNWEPIDVVSHVLYPAALPDCRMVIITWWAHDDSDDARHVDTALGDTTVESTAKAQPLSASGRRAAARAMTGHISVPTAEAAAALAGPDGIALPVLSAMMGEDCQLTLSPSARSVIWAVRQPDGTWTASEVQAYTAVVQLPQAATEPEAHTEMKQIVRAVLPPGTTDAWNKIQERIPQLTQQIRCLEQIARDLCEEDSSLPHVWHPVDEI